MAVGTEIRRRPKRLIVCCDGTWQSSVALKRNVPSNVTRLARSFARTDDRNPDDVWDQVVHYDAGIGTGEIPTVEALRQGGVGAGFSGNVIEAYNFLVLNYKDGDKIYCFGFSRGAYTARAVAGLVNDIGIISPRDMQDFPELYQNYEWPDKVYDYDTTHPNWFRKSHYYRQWRCGIPARTKDGTTRYMHGTELRLWDKFPHEPASEASRQVEVVGVFDTVGSLGVPDTAMHTFNVVKKGIRWLTNGGTAPGFHNVNLSKYTRHAYHALALDEHRGPFSPTLWHLPSEERKDDERTHDQIKAAYKEAEDTVHRLFEKTSHIPNDEIKNDPRKLDPLKKAWADLMDCSMAFVDGKNSKFYLEDSELEQVWFPGYHINIGGGSDEAFKRRRGDFEQIALISFAWMCDKIKPFLKFEDKLHKRTVGDRMALINPILAEISQNEKRDYGHWMVEPFWKAADAVVPGYNCPQMKVEETTQCGWATGPIFDSSGVEYTLIGNKVRTPGGYLVDDVTGEPAGETNERIHPCIPYRMEMIKGKRLKGGEQAYQPQALAGFQRIYHKGEWMWVKKEVLQEREESWTLRGNFIKELKIDEKLKFSLFMTKNHLKYLDEVVIQHTRLNKEKNADKAALARAKKDAESHVAKSTAVCNTLAMDFLEVTKGGKNWMAPAPALCKKVNGKF